MQSNNNEKLDYEAVTQALDNLVYRKNVEENYRIVRAAINAYFDIVEKQNRDNA